MRNYEDLRGYGFETAWDLEELVSFGKETMVSWTVHFIQNYYISLFQPGWTVNFDFINLNVCCGCITFLSALHHNSFDILLCITLYNLEENLFLYCELRT